MKFSIVIPVYNAECTIDMAIRSVLAQTYQNIEIICVNDGSSDDSLNKLQQWRLEDKRITVVSFERNRGVAAARVEGLSKTTGDYILFLDADDLLSPTCCETLCSTVQECAADIIAFGTQNAFSDYVEEATRKTVIENGRVCLGQLNGLQIADACYLDGVYTHTIWNKAYSRRIVFDVLKRPVEDGLVMLEDYYLYFLFSNIAETYFGIEDKLYVYNYGEGVSAANILNESKVRVYNTSKRAIDAARNYAAEINQLEHFEPAFKKMEQECSAGIVWRLLVAEELSWDAYFEAVEIWGGENLVNILQLFHQYPQQRKRKLMTAALSEGLPKWLQKLMQN